MDPTAPREPPAAPDLQPGVTVVIPTFNRAAELVRAIGALAAQDVPGLRVTIVDNSSADDTPQRIAALAPAWDGRLAYVRKVPEGPASARNVGLASVATRYVLFQDSDILLPADWVRRAMAHLDADASLGGVGGYILYAFDPQRVNAYGGDLGLTGLAWDVGEGTALDPAQPARRRIWINCSAMLARTAAVREVGGFDDRFFYGYEDSDLGWRLNLAGHAVAVHPDLRALHHVAPAPGAANAVIIFHYCKNRLAALLKDASGRTLPAMLARYALYTGADLLLRGHRRPKLAALAWNLRHLRETLAMRRRVQALRRTPDREVFALGSRRWFPPSPLHAQRRRPVPGASPAPASDAGARDDRV